MFLALLLNQSLIGQTTIASWNFDFGGTNNVTSPNNSGIIITSVGTSAAYYSSVSCPHGGEAIANNWSVNDHWKTTSALNFTGYTNLTYSFNNWSFPNGPTGTFKFQYSLNNSNWTDITSYNVNATSGCNASNPYSNVSLPAVLLGQSSVYFRWINNGNAGASGAGNRLDGVEFKGVGSGSCTDPDVPTVTANSVCLGSSTNLSINGNLNNATTWRIYTGSCGGTLVGSTASNTFSVSPTSNTTYYVRGEGGCVTPGSCGSKTVNVIAKDNANFNYSASSYCTDASDPSPTITGLPSGSFSSTSGLSITSAGVIDVSASTPNTYTVTYTTAGTCPNSSTQSVTINALDDASFSYSSGNYCIDASDPSPTLTGLPSGSFSSTSGLSITSAGVIDVSASTPNTYTITYTTNGICPNSSTQSVTINALDDPSFTYSSNNYCPNSPDPTPTISGLTGGMFSSTAGLDIIPSSGLIDLSETTPGTYTVTYTTAGICPNSSTFSLFVGDTIKPILTPPADQNKLLGLNCLFTVPDYTGLVGIIDNCDPAPGIIQSPAPGTDLGTTSTISFTITDASGNSSSTSLELNLSPLIHRDTILVYSGRNFTFVDGYTETNITDTLTHLSTLTSVVFGCDSLQATFAKVIYPPCNAKGRRTTFEWIQEVTIGNVTNTSGRSTGGYQNFITQTVIAEQGDTISVSLTPGYKRRAYIENWRIWVDWNFNGDFTDAGELIFQSSGKNTQTGEFIVPNGVEKGKLALRTIMSWKHFTTSCSTSKNGEVEDYTIQILNPVNTPLSIAKQAQPNYDTHIPDSESIFEFAEIYPNPIQQGYKLNLTARSNLTESRLVIVTNSLGQVLHSEIVEFKEGITDFQLDTRTLPQGFYIVSIHEGNESTPIIVQ